MPRATPANFTDLRWIKYVNVLTHTRPVPFSRLLEELSENIRTHVLSVNVWVFHVSVADAVEYET